MTHRPEQTPRRLKGIEDLTTRGLETGRGGLRVNTGRADSAASRPFHPCISCGTLLSKNTSSSLCSTCRCPVHFGFSRRVCGCTP